MKASTVIIRKIDDLADLRPRRRPSKPKIGMPSRPAVNMFCLPECCDAVAVPLVEIATVIVPVCTEAADAMEDGLKLQPTDITPGASPGGVIPVPEIDRHWKDERLTLAGRMKSTELVLPVVAPEERVRGLAAKRTVTANVIDRVRPFLLSVPVSVAR